MPKGPQGQKRPADAVANAVMVARIATGEIEDDGYVHNPKRNQQAGGLARARKLSAEQRSQIARDAAAKRWNERSDDMTENDQLLRSLFEHTQHERTHLNVKFLRGTADDISEEDFRQEAANALVQVDSGMAECDAAFGESFKQVAIVDFVNAL